MQNVLSAVAHRCSCLMNQVNTDVYLLYCSAYGTLRGYVSSGALAHVFLYAMTGGWQLLKNVTAGATYGKVRDGFQTEEKFTIAMVADIILEHKKSPLM